MQCEFWLQIVGSVLKIENQDQGLTHPLLPFQIRLFSQFFASSPLHNVFSMLELNLFLFVFVFLCFEQVKVLADCLSIYTLSAITISK